jgi:hypothetical protein
MAPSRSTAHSSTNVPNAVAGDGGDAADDELFLEPMMGTPLAIYVEKDVSDREALVELITVRAICPLEVALCLTCVLCASETWWTDITRLQRCSIYPR